jgi:hypothetical protein
MKHMRSIEESLAPACFLKGVNDQQLRWKIEEWMKHWCVPGVSIAVINEGVIDWARGYGEYKIIF